jgi:hypothetical protein
MMLEFFLLPYFFIAKSQLLQHHKIIIIIINKTYLKRDNSWNFRSHGQLRPHTGPSLPKHSPILGPYPMHKMVTKMS